MAAFGRLLRESEYIGGFTHEEALNLTRKAKGADREAYRAEAVQLAETAALLAKQPSKE